MLQGFSAAGAQEHRDGACACSLSGRHGYRGGVRQSMTAAGQGAGQGSCCKE